MCTDRERSVPSHGRSLGLSAALQAIDPSWGRSACLRRRVRLGGSSPAAVPSSLGLGLPWELPWDAYKELLLGLYRVPCRPCCPRPILRLRLGSTSPRPLLRREGFCSFSLANSPLRRTVLDQRSPDSPLRHQGRLRHADTSQAIPDEQTCKVRLKERGG